MELATAVAVWKRLEAENRTEWEGDPPVYDVRLDASTNMDKVSNHRYFRIRVLGAKGTGGLDADEWRYVMDVANEFDLGLDVSNNALELY